MFYFCVSGKTRQVEVTTCSLLHSDFFLLPFLCGSVVKTALTYKLASTIFRISRPIGSDAVAAGDGTFST